MFSGPQRVVSGGRSLVIALFAGMTLMAAVGASAASLGGLRSNTLFATSQTVPPLGPATIACDTFALAAPTGTALVNRPVRPSATCGTSTWTVHSGTWVIVNGDLDASSNDSSATVPAGSTNVSVSATLVNSSGGGRAAGVAIDHNGAAAPT